VGLGKRGRGGGQENKKQKGGGAERGGRRSRGWRNAVSELATFGSCRTENREERDSCSGKYRGGTSQKRVRNGLLKGRGGVMHTKRPWQGEAIARGTRREGKTKAE